MAGEQKKYGKCGRLDKSESYIYFQDIHLNVSICSLHQTVPESLYVNATIDTVLATDGDGGIWSNIKYSIQNDPSGSFIITPFTGTLKLGKKLDRETAENYTLVIEASDGEMSSTLNFSITVSDANDNSPFPTSLTNVIGAPSALWPHWNISDMYLGNLTIIEGSRGVIGRLYADDNDTGANADVYYVIPLSNLAFHTQGSGLLLSAPFDREVIEYYNLSVLLIDRGIPALTSTVALSVRIQDVNDNAPEFDPDFVDSEIPYSHPVGQLVTAIGSVDIDEGSNTHVDYSIGAGSSNKFTIGLSNGESIAY